MELFIVCISSFVIFVFFSWDTYGIESTAGKIIDSAC